MARVKAAQQRQGGGGANFQPQVRHTGGKKKKKQKGAKNPPSANKYAKLKGVIKPKPEVQERYFMQVCHCNNSGTCTFCVQKRRQELEQRIRQTEPRRSEDNMNLLVRALRFG